MSRYTGPSWKQARRLGLSLTGTGKDWHVVTTYQVNTDQTTVQNCQNTVCNWLKNKNFVSLTV